MKKSFLVSSKFIIIAACISLASVIVVKSATNDLLGYSWSDTIGWISMSASTSPSYAVTLNNDGTLSGYAWSDTVGWVQFGGLSNFPSGPGTTAANAQVNTTTGAVTGWARALVGCQNDLWNGSACTGGGPGNANGVITTTTSSATSSTFTTNWTTTPLFGQRVDSTPPAGIPLAMAKDTSYIYTSGLVGSGGSAQAQSGNQQGYLEKRNIATGALVWSKYVGVSITAVAVDSTGVYVSGLLNTAQSYPDYVIKYDLNGVQLWKQNVTSSTGTGLGYAQIFIQNGYLYGISQPNGPPLFVDQRNPSTGALNWSKVDSTRWFAGWSFATDTGIYVIANDSSSNDYLSQRSLTDGTVTWSVNIGSQNTIMGPSVIGADSTGVYYAYITGSVPSYVTHYEKRSLSTGALLWSKLESNWGAGTLWLDFTAAPAYLTNSGLYTGVRLINTANFYGHTDFQLQKRDPSTGNIISTTTAQSYPVNPSVMLVANNHIYTGFLGTTTNATGTWILKDVIDNSVSGGTSVSTTNAGWDGWISLSGTLYTSPNFAGTGGMTYSSSTGGFIGYAWGSDVMGWLSFTSSPITTVNAPKAPAPLCTSLTATPASVSQGNSFNLSWATSNAASCSITNSLNQVYSNATTSPSGISITPAGNLTYTLSCNNTNTPADICSKSTSVSVTTAIPVTQDNSGLWFNNDSFKRLSNVTTRANKTTKVNWDVTGLMGVGYTSCVKKVSTATKTLGTWVDGTALPASTSPNTAPLISLVNLPVGSHSIYIQCSDPSNTLSPVSSTTNIGKINVLPATIREN
jgi:hypothetical protein